MKHLGSQKSYYERACKSPFCDGNHGSEIQCHGLHSENWANVFVGLLTVICAGKPVITGIEYWAFSFTNLFVTSQRLLNPIDPFALREWVYQELSCYSDKNVKFAESGLIRNIDCRHNEFDVPNYWKITNVIPLAKHVGYEPVACEPVHNASIDIRLGFVRTRPPVAVDVVQYVDRPPAPEDLLTEIADARARVTPAAALQADHQVAGTSGIQSQVNSSEDLQARMAAARECLYFSGWRAGCRHFRSSTSRSHITYSLHCSVFRPNWYLCIAYSLPGSRTLCPAPVCCIYCWWASQLKWNTAGCHLWSSSGYLYCRDVPSIAAPVDSSGIPQTPPSGSSLLP